MYRFPPEWQFLEEPYLGAGSIQDLVRLWPVGRVVGELVVPDWSAPTGWRSVPVREDVETPAPARLGFRGGGDA